jgi:hypothetical protein
MSRSFNDLTLSGDLNLGPASQINNNGLDLTLPTVGTGIIPSIDSTSTFTNKTITSTTNNVAANSLQNGATWSVAMSGPAPSANQVLATDGLGNVTWVANGYETPVTVTTNNATPTTLFTYPTTANTVINITATISAFDSTTPANNSAFIIKAAFYTNGVGTITQLLPSIDKTYFGPLIQVLDSTYTISGTSVNITVTGTGIDTIQWSGRISAVTAA